MNMKSRFKISDFFLVSIFYLICMLIPIFYLIFSITVGVCRNRINLGLLGHSNRENPMSIKDTQVLEGTSTLTMRRRVNENARIRPPWAELRTPSGHISQNLLEQRDANISLWESPTLQKDKSYTRVSFYVEQVQDANQPGVIDWRERAITPFFQVTGKTPYEPNDTQEYAYPIVIDIPQRHTFHDINDADWVYFYAYNGEAYYIGANDPIYGYFIKITLCDANGIIIHQEGFNNPSYFEELWHCTQNGYYTLKVESASDFEDIPFSYELLVGRYEAPIPTADIQGSVVDQNHEGINGLDVYIRTDINTWKTSTGSLRDVRKPASYITDPSPKDEGWYFMENLQAPGYYKITVTAKDDHNTILAKLGSTYLYENNIHWINDIVIVQDLLPSQNDPNKEVISGFEWVYTRWQQILGRQYIPWEDTDNDGFTNMEEFLSGTDTSDPNNPTLKPPVSAQDFVRLGKVGECNNNYGYFNAVYVKEINGVTYAFCATSKGLAVYNIHYKNTGQNKTKADVSFVSFVPLGYSTDIFINEKGREEKGIYAYITIKDKGIYIRDVTNPAFSYHISSCDTPGEVLGVAISGDYAFVADGDSALQVIDISDPTRPWIIGSCDTPGDVLGVAISEDYAFVADWINGLQVIDISNPTEPSIVGSCDTTGYAYGLAISEGYAFVADCGSGLQVIDINNPTEPSIVGSCNTTGYANGLAISGGYAFVADGGSGLQVIDIKDPTGPVIVRSCDTPGHAYGLAISGEYVFVADWESGLQVIDIRDPTGTLIVGNSDTPGHAYGLSISGGYVFVADYSSGLKVIDISDHMGPRIAGSCDTPSSARGIDISGGYAFVADYISGLQVIDISDPTGPVIVGSCGTPGDALGVAIARIGAREYAFVADGYWGVVDGYWGGLQVIDISDHNRPRIVGRCETPGRAEGVAISTIGTVEYTFVADMYSGLQVIDISDHNRPRIVGSCETPGGAEGVAISTIGTVEYAFVVDGYSGLQVINISVPNRPRIVGSCETSGGAEGVAISTIGTVEYAFVAFSSGWLGYESGLQVIDISDPNRPRIVGSCNTPDYAYGVAIARIGSGDYAFVADGSNGLLKLKINIGPPPEGKGNLILVAGGNINYKALSQKTTNPIMRKRGYASGTFDPNESCWDPRTSYWQITQALANHVFNTFQKSGYEVYDIYLIRNLSRIRTMTVSSITWLLMNPTLPVKD